MSRSPSSTGVSGSATRRRPPAFTHNPTPSREPMTKITESVDLDRRGHVAVLTVNNPPVNALSRHVRQGLHEGLMQAGSDAAVQAGGITLPRRPILAGPH